MSGRFTKLVGTLAAVACVALFAPPDARAAALYSCQAGTFDSVDYNSVGASCTETTAPLSPPLVGTATAGANAGPGGIGAGAGANVTLPNGQSSLLYGPSNSAGASIIFDDVYITGPAGGGTTVDAALNLFVHAESGLLTVGITQTPADYGSFAHGTASLNLSVTGTDSGDNLLFYDEGGLTFSETLYACTLPDCTPDPGHVSGATTTATEMLDGKTIDDLLAGVTLQTASGELPVDQPITLQLDVGVSAGAGINAAAIPGGCPSCTGYASAGLGAYNTITLPTNGPVFDLPDGYTANTADGCIANNLYVCGASAPTSVSEPPAIWLFGFGLIALLGFERRRRKPGNSRAA